MDPMSCEPNDWTVRQRLGLVVGINFSGDEANLQQEWKTVFDGICNVPWTSFACFDKPLQKWRWRDLTIGTLPLNFIESSFEFLSADKASSRIHSLLDELPNQSTFLLDVICVCVGWPKSAFPALLYGAIRRAITWHGAKVILISLESTKPNNLFHDIQVEVLTLNEFCKSFSFDNLQSTSFWRGHVSLFDDSSKKFVDIPGFELSGLESNSISKVEELMSKGKRSLKACDKRIHRSLLSYRLKVISMCRISSVPLFYLTPTKFSLRSSGVRNSVSVRNFFELCNSSQGLIVSLDYGAAKVSSSFLDSCLDKGSKASINTDKWKKWVLHGMKKEEEPNRDESLCEKPIEQIFFLVFDPDHRSIEKMCVLLDHSRGGITRSFSLIQDTSLMKSSTIMPSIDSFESEIDLHSFKRCFEEIHKKISNMFQRTKPDTTEKQSYQASFHFCSKILSQKVNGPLVSKALCNLISPVNTSTKDVEKFYGNESNWEERRFLCLVEHNKRMAAERKLKLSREMDSTMKPSGDFVIMEANELLKLFDKDGNPKPGTELQSLGLPESKQNNSSADDDTVASVSKPSSWPNILWSNFPDLYYLKDDQSEAKDRELSKIQQIYVGLRETVSTCNSQNSSKDSEVITKSLQTKQPINSKSSSSQLITKQTNLVDRKQPQKSISSSLCRRSPRKLIGPSKKFAPVDKKNSLSAQKFLAQKVKKPAGNVPLSGSFSFKKLLRCAVFIALFERNITEASPIFNPCCKRLFDICKMYAKDIPAKVRTEEEIKKWLNALAEQNADTVVKLVKSLRE